MSDLTNIVIKLRSLKPYLIERYKIKAIGIFGSYVRNEQTSKSDIDILVDFSEPIGLEFIKLANELERELDEKVDLVSLKGIKPKYLSYVEKDLRYV